MSLYNKYRPSSFEEMKGNYSKIGKMLSKPEHNHTLLFVGPSGTGKTTAARILASMVGATDLDITEINGSDQNGIDDFRVIIQDLNMAPAYGKKSVYIIDEFHKVTTQAQNALLKPLEDVPDHVYFILCSSEPKNIIKAIQTRASTFSFAPLTSDDLFDILRDVKKAEGFQIGKDALYDIAESSGGSARTALNSLEAVMACSSEEEVAAYLRSLRQEGGLDDGEIIDLCRLLYGSDRCMWKELARVLSSLKEGGKEPEGVRRAILGYGAAILLKNGGDDVALKMDQFQSNYFDTGFTGLVSSCYKAWAKEIRGF